MLPPFRGHCLQPLFVNALQQVSVLGVGMRYFLVLCLFYTGCNSDDKADGWDVDTFQPRIASSFQATPQGRLRASGIQSVSLGYVTDQEIDTAIDAAFLKFAQVFPELPIPNPRIHLQDDYVMRVQGQWASGWTISPSDVVVCLWSRGNSAINPGACFIARPPDSNYSTWRFNSSPLVPALVHELIHCAVSDPLHHSVYFTRGY